MKWYAGNNVHRLDWPAQSPDLNPIEHLWNELDRRLRSREMRPTSIVQLSAMLQEKWRRIPVDILHKLVESMPDRVAAVIPTRVSKGAKPVPNYFLVDSVFVIRNIFTIVSVEIHVQSMSPSEMEEYTRAEYADLIFEYGSANGNSRQAHRLYREKYPRRRHPAHTIFPRLFQSGNGSGTVVVVMVVAVEAVTAAAVA
ncbi:hypothetical protein ANN_11375 [Periplaneta americana]|uniref:DUF4817 domain-containing protein n=1 Tax=Periplaneta americana TaxID=6978 RepID=A0ABQ8T4U4_PERAM|nr:hypothetical protein ANN_11375 [Periplaneta americana]